jgi:hypothetical protein
MDCRTARLLLEFARPSTGELDVREVEHLDEHLTACAECNAAARAERDIDAHLGRAMRTVAVPQEPRSRLLARLRQERNRWYRRHLWTPAAAAAAVLIVLGVWFGLSRQGGLPVANLDEFYHRLNSRLGAPPSQVAEWFRDTYQLHTTVPPQFDYTWLAFYDLADFEGKRVPFLFFIRDDAVARVYVLSDSQFDLDRLEKPAGYSAVEVLRHPTDKHFAYVVIYTSKQLDWFLDKAQREAACVPRGLKTDGTKLGDELFPRLFEQFVADRAGHRYT